MNFFNILKNEHNIQLNKDQQKALKHFKGPALTLAIPGSGKTTLLLCRLHYLKTLHNIPLENTLTLTFSKASAIDLEKRYETLFSSQGTSMNFSTIHKFSYDIVKKYYYHRQINFTLIEGKNSYYKINTLKSIYHKLNHNHISPDDLEALMNDLSYCANMMIKEPYDSSIKNFDEILKSYKDYKKKNRMIDFDDMLLIALRVLERYPDILKMYHEKFPFIQVDEAQDTSILQHQLIKKLSEGSNNIFMVADDDQSIYGFRGAYPKYLLDFNMHYKSGKIYYLKNNYRSSFEIIDTCKRFIDKNDDRYSKDIINNNAKDQPIDIIEFDDFYKRDTYLLNYLSHNITEESAVLYRNNISGLSLINLLFKNNISFNIRGKNTKIFNHWLLKDMKAFFNFILIPQDIDSFERICFKLNSYISKKMINYLRLNIRDQEVFDCLIQNPSLKSFQKDTLRNLKIIFDDARDKTPLEILNIIKYDLNYLSYLSDFATRSNNHYDTLKEKIRMLEGIAAKESSAFEFINQLENLESFLKDHRNELNHQVVLSTMHSAKGLEFDNVFIIDVRDNILPQSTDTLEEDRRLLYVALSRAKSTLNLLHTKFVSGKFNSDIQFINELKESPHVNYRIYRAKEKFTLEVGEIVHHKSFGTGKIIDISPLNVSISFNRSLKVLSKDICIKNNLLVKADSQ